MQYLPECSQQRISSTHSKKLQFCTAREGYWFSVKKTTTGKYSHNKLTVQNLTAFKKLFEFPAKGVGILQFPASLVFGRLVIAPSTNTWSESLFKLNIMTQTSLPCPFLHSIPSDPHGPGLLYNHGLVELVSTFLL